MLFSEEEFTRLRNFKSIASVLNTYNLNFENIEFLQSFSKYYKFNINANFNILKNLVLSIEGVANRKPSYYHNVAIIMFTLSDNLNINLSSKVVEEGEKFIFFDSFIKEMRAFLERLRELKLSDNENKSMDLIKFLNQEDFHLIYTNINNVINQIADTPRLHTNSSESLIGTNIYNDKVVILEDRVNSLIKEFKALNSDYLKNKDENFDLQKRVFEERANEAFFNYKNYLNELNNQYQSEIGPQLINLKADLQDSKAELDALLGDVELYQDKMTNNAVNEMSAHYYEKSKFERNSYFVVTIASALIIIFSVISAYKGVNNYYNQYVGTESCDKTEVVETQEMILPPVKGKSYEECMKDLTVKRELTQKYAFNYLIFRLSFSVLLFLAVIYASRIAMRAYNHWRQSENMYLKLNTLSPFIGSLDKSVRNEVHLSLVPDYFGKDAGIVENPKDSVKDLPTNMSNIVIKAIEQAGNTIGSKLGSDKESKNSDRESSTEKNKKKSEDESQ
ncbi:hypothetical protein RMB12_02435 [Acinetobacter sp. V117_2]|uniref:hypothetical protein n=1 Tax=Acinetobacter sp. V117_2 TaxID=3072989 RepID=UPI00287E8017|nr:hypothetical protein [Acinetobacter sp. V117_2]MDS7965888.1 hypothetical protein [Acinetobacter sp. V117_2]